MPAVVHYLAKGHRNSVILTCMNWSRRPWYSAILALYPVKYDCSDCSDCSLEPGSNFGAKRCYSTHVTIMMQNVVKISDPTEQWAMMYWKKQTAVKHAVVVADAHLPVIIVLAIRSRDQAL